MLYRTQVPANVSSQDNVGDPEKAPLYCHWDTHCEDFSLQSQTEFELHLKSHLSQIPPIDNDYTEPVACHWDSCHETFLNVDSMMAHWQSFHYQDSFHPHYAENNCPRYDLGQEHSLLANQDHSHGALSHTHACGHFHDSPVDAPGFVRADHNVRTPSVGPDLRHLPDLTSSIRSTPLHSLPDGTEDIRCLWTHDGEVCNRVFSSTADLKDHLESEHIASRQHNYYCGWAGCERCQRPFAQRQKLIRHLQVHTRHREHKCHICNRLFAEERVLKQHMRTHSGEKPSKCSFCGKCFSSHSALTVHKRVHTGEKPLVCKVPGCGKRFSESSNLAKHMKTHCARTFRCDNCGRMFARKDQLVRHMRTHRPHPQASPGLHQSQSTSGLEKNNSVGPSTASSTSVIGGMSIPPAPLAYSLQ